MTNMLTAFLVGVISGMCNIFFSQAEAYESFMMFMVLLGAGIPFGIITGLYFNHALKVIKPLRAIIVWTVFSAASYFLAVQTYLQLHAEYSSIDAVNLAVAAALGVLVVVIGFRFSYRKIPVTPSLIMVAAISCVVVAAYALAKVVDVEEIYFIYVGFQTAVTVLLFYFAQKLA